MNDKLNLEVTIKPALTVEHIREELADMYGLPINDETRAEMVRRLNAMGLFDFGVQAKPTHSDECLMLDTSHLTEADIEDLKAKFRSTSRCGQPLPVLADRQHVVELPTMSILGQFPADQRETAANVLLMCKRAVLDSGAAVKMGAWTEGDAAVAELVQEAMQDVAGGKTYTHEEAKQLMAERRAKVEASKPTCTDERPCVNWEQYDRLVAHADDIIYDKTKNTLADWISDYGGRKNERGYVEFGSHYALAKMLDRRDKEIIRNVLAAMFSESAAPASTPEADDLTQFLEQTDFDAAEKAAGDTVANQRELPAGEDDCEGCKI